MGDVPGMSHMFDGYNIARGLLNAFVYNSKTATCNSKHIALAGL